MKAIAGRALIAYANVIGPLAASWGRTAFSVAGIALGVALALAVNLINQSAAGEFALAAQKLSGEADLIVRGPRAGFSEELYPKIANFSEVAHASPGIELQVKLYGRDDALKVLGLDPLQAVKLQPALSKGAGVERYALLQPDTVLLSAFAARKLGIEKGDTIQFQVGLAAVAFKVIDLLPEASYAQPLAVMDIANAQWRLEFLGRVNRLDLRLRPGTDIETFRKRLLELLPPGVFAAPPEAEAKRSDNMSRAYRVNLNVLSLVALFTGAFLVFSTQALAVLRRRSQLALTRVLGTTRCGLVAQLALEGTLIGIVGAALGVVLGYGAAAITLEHFGPDLGGGYFEGLAPTLRAEPLTLFLFFASGVAAALTGALVPALEAAAASPAQALRSGGEEQAVARVRRFWPGMVLIASGVAATQVPPIAGLPLFGYLAVALVLVGAVLLVPGLVAACLRYFPLPRRAAAQIAVSQLKGAPGLSAISLASILVSFTLMVAMAIMVASFRGSLENWLYKIAPADLYVRAGGETAHFGESDQAAIRAVPGVNRAQFQRFQKLLLDAEKPPVTLIARTVDSARAERVLPLTDWADDLPYGLPPAWVSEAMADLYGIRVNEVIALPIGGASVDFFVAGVWRDYARQSGAIIIPREVYVQLTGDKLADNAALWLESPAAGEKVARRVEQALPAGIEVSLPSEIREASLKIFDRTFAITYALEAIAVLVGLIGVSVAYSARVIARRGQFSMLRHVGMLEQEVAAMVALEGLLEAVLGAAFGLVLGFGVSLILIHVVNRQSFHWSMDLDPPWLLLIALAAALIAAASLTAYLSARRALSGNLIRAVREDW
jgi:putative ABC transport system permease protein